MRTALAALLFALAASATAADPPLPKAGEVRTDPDRGEVILSARIQIPEGKECIDKYGERIQAFVGTERAAGRSAKMAEYFVFLVDAPAEDVHAGMMKLGCRPKVHYSMAEGKKRAGWRPGGRGRADRPLRVVRGQCDAVRLRQRRDAPGLAQPAAVGDVHLADLAGAGVEEVAEGREVRHALAGGNWRAHCLVDHRQPIDALRPARLLEEVEAVGFERLRELQTHRRRRPGVAVHHDVDPLAHSLAHRRE